MLSPKIFQFLLITTDEIEGAYEIATIHNGILTISFMLILITMINYIYNHKYFTKYFFNY